MKRKKSNKNVVIEALKEGQKPNTPDENSITQLQEIYGRYYDEKNPPKKEDVLAKLLIKYGVKVDATIFKNQFTSLFYASALGNDSVVKALVKDVNYAIFASGCVLSPLYLALCFSGGNREKTIEFLVENSNNDVIRNAYLLICADCYARSQLINVEKDQKRLYEYKQALKIQFANLSILCACMKKYRKSIDLFEGIFIDGIDEARKKINNNSNNAEFFPVMFAVAHYIKQYILERNNGQFNEERGVKGLGSDINDLRKCDVDMNAHSSMPQRQDVKQKPFEEQQRKFISLIISCSSEISKKLKTQYSKKDSIFNTNPRTEKTKPQTDNNSNLKNTPQKTSQKTSQ